MGISSSDKFVQHTRHALEALHPNIGVFRHPDHVPTDYDIKQELGESFSKLRTFDLAQISGDALKALYGAAGDVVLYWAHHEKLLVVDRKLGFMGGLDMCMPRDPEPLSKQVPLTELQVTGDGIPTVSRWEVDIIIAAHMRLRPSYCRRPSRQPR